MSQITRNFSGVVPPVIGTVVSLTTEDATVVHPNGAGNINVVGAGVNVSTSGDDTTHTVTISWLQNLTVTGNNVLFPVPPSAGDNLNIVGDGTTVTVTGTPGTNTLTISAMAGAFPWTVITGASQAMAVNNGYIANNAGTVSFALPTVCAVGDRVRVTGMNNNTGWQITQQIGQQVYFGDVNTTLGTMGSMTSSNTRDSVELVCVVANTIFNVISSIGNITIA